MWFFQWFSKHGLAQSLKASEQYIACIVPTAQIASIFGIWYFIYSILLYIALFLFKFKACTGLISYMKRIIYDIKRSVKSRAFFNGKVIYYTSLCIP